MFFTTARRARRETQVPDRLAQMTSDGAGSPDPAEDPPDDQRWIDESEPGPAGGAWWRGGPGRLVERWLPAAGPPRRRLSIGLVAALVVGVALAAGVLFSSGDGREPPPELPAAQGSPASVAPISSTSAVTIVVSVVGRVVHPGLVSLPDGARVADALQAAGGPVPGADLSGLNIARRLADGEQIYVGIPAPPGSAPGGASGGGPDKVDLNAASVAELDTLPGVGAVTAQRIVDWRTRHGRFTSVEQLREVDGIGPAKYGQLKDLVVVR